MPADRELAGEAGRAVAAIFQDLEDRLTADMARRLAAGQADPDWAVRKRAAAGDLRRFAERLVRQVDGRLGDVVAQQLMAAYSRGSAAALDELVRLGRPVGKSAAAWEKIARRTGGALDRLTRARAAIPGADAVLRMVGALTGSLRGTYAPIVRWAADAYQEVVTRAAVAGVLGGIDARRPASQRAWQGLLGRGITGFTDRAGRRWNLASYVEMATRTGAAQAAVEGHLDRLADAGLELVIVSNSPQECPRCRPWEGKILARGGAAGRRTVQAEHAIVDGRVVRVEIAGSVQQAISAGLMHPNCTHSLSAYLPGLTVAPERTADPEAGRARERQRELERRVRRDKLRAAAAIDPAAGARFAARARETQAQIRQHVADNAHHGLRRKPERESLNLGNRSAAPAPVGKPAPTRQATYADRVGNAATGSAALDAVPISIRREADIARLSTAEMSTIRQYKGTLASNLNDVLRRQKGRLPNTFGFAVYRESLALLKKVFARSKLKSDVVVWRGIKDGRGLFGDRWDRSLVGAEAVEYAPMSTSASAEIAGGREFTGASGAVMRILLPKGTGAIQLSGAEYESEILARPGLRLRVISDTGPGANRVIDVEAL